jgi:hypothetical protein
MLIKYVVIVVPTYGVKDKEESFSRKHVFGLK